MAPSRLFADVREPLRVVNWSRDQDMSVKGAPHGRAEPPSFLWPVNSVCATLRYSSSPVGGIEQFEAEDARRDFAARYQAAEERGRRMTLRAFRKSGAALTSESAVP